VTLRSLLAAARRSIHEVTAGSLEALVRCAALLAPADDSLPAEPRSIFVLRNNDVGDLLIVTPLFDALRRRFPDAHIAAGIGSWNLDVLRGNPHLSEVLPVNAPWFNKYQRRQSPARRLAYVLGSPEVRTLARRHFEVGIDVLGSAWGALLLQRAGIRCRLGVRGYAGGHSATSAALLFDPTLHVGRAALRFAVLLGATDLPDCRPQIFLGVGEIEEAERRWAAATEGDRRKRRIVVGPGGGLAAKRWPAPSFVELTARLPELASEVSILVLGGPAEEVLVARVAATSSHAWSLSEAPRLRQVFALVATADLVICTSSMLMHVAAAFARPTLVLLGESFSSASAHQAQWGYPGTCLSLGKEPGARAHVYMVGEVLEMIAETMLRTALRAPLS
jgi:ADP-heptose:LPS heptosyltransferase